MYNRTPLYNLLQVHHNSGIPPICPSADDLVSTRCHALSTQSAETQDHVVVRPQGVTLLQRVPGGTTVPHFQLPRVAGDQQPLLVREPQNVTDTRLSAGVHQVEVGTVPQLLEGLKDPEVPVPDAPGERGTGNGEATVCISEGRQRKAQSFPRISLPPSQLTLPVCYRVKACRIHDFAFQEEQVPESHVGE